MPLAKRRKLPRGFPMELPLPDGTVVSFTGHEAKSRGIWLYTLEVTGTPVGVTSWYAQSYAASNWDLRRLRGGGGSPITIEFAKGDAESILKLQTAKTPGRTRVEATVSLGARASPAD